MDLTQELLNNKFSADKKNGWHASFYSSGQLKEYGLYLDGVSRGWSIHLGDNDGTARVEFHEQHNYPDPMRPDGPLSAKQKEQQFEMWVAAQMDAIIEKAVVLNRCSFCHRRDHEVRTLITGPGVMICDQCVSQCSQICAQ